MFSSCARSNREDETCWVAIRDIDEPGRDTVASELARVAAQGHRVAQRELFRRLASRVHETLLAVLGSNEQMELHLQNAFVEIFRSLRNYDRAHDLGAWACAIVVRAALREHDDHQCHARPPKAAEIGNAARNGLRHDNGFREPSRAETMLNPLQRWATGLCKRTREGTNESIA
jgi:DNA-directed RNA polymerase specialized sigma24 family protein